MKKPSIIIVTGKSGSGKSEISIRIAKMYNYTIINIGDLLLDELIEKGYQISNRSDIGIVFMEVFGIHGYLGVLNKKIISGNIVDGIRLFEGVNLLKNMFLDTVHIHRTLQGFHNNIKNQTIIQNDNFSQDNSLMIKSADFIIGRVKSLESLDRRIKDILNE